MVRRRIWIASLVVPVAATALYLAGPRVAVDTRGGRLQVAWAGGDAPVLMTGPATTVFEGAIDL